MLYLEKTAIGYELHPVETEAERRQVYELGFHYKPGSRTWLSPGLSYPQFLRLCKVFPYLYVAPLIYEDMRTLVQYRTHNILSQQSLATVPSNLPLDPYQIQGANFLVTARRAILGDAVGLGKTPQLIAAADAVQAKHILIVAPKSILHQWMQEIVKFSQGDTYAQIVNRQSPIIKRRWTITNYETTMRKDLSAFQFDCIIYDEAVRLKNRHAQRTLRSYLMTANTPYLWLATGEPIRSYPDELWSLLRLVDPTAYGGDIDEAYWQFVRYYCVIFSIQGRPQVGRLKHEKVTEFQQEIAPYLIRRDKSILHLPPLSQETIRLQMLPRQDQAYWKAHSGLLIRDAKAEVIQGDLAKLTRLRQLACDPRLVGIDTPGIKTEWLLDWLGDHPSEKVIILSNFAEYIRLLVQQHRVLKTTCASITGDMTADRREMAKTIFMDGGTCQTLYISAQAGAEGLNLQAATTVIWMDKPWTPDVVEQGTARAWRRGVEHPVHEISLVAEGSIDESIERLLERKEKIISEALAIRWVLDDLIRQRRVI